MGVKKIDTEKESLIFDNNETNSKLNTELYTSIGLNFYFNDETSLLGEFDKLNSFFEKKGFTKIFETEDIIKNTNGHIDEKVLYKLNDLSVLNISNSYYNYITNIYFPGDGVYTFYFTPSSINKNNDRVYHDINEYLSSIKSFLELKKDEEYFMSMFSSNPGNGKGPNFLRFEVVNNKDYTGNIKKVA